MSYWMAVEVWMNKSLENICTFYLVKNNKNLLSLRYFLLSSTSKFLGC